MLKDKPIEKEEEIKSSSSNLDKAKLDIESTEKKEENSSKETPSKDIPLNIKDEISVKVLTDESELNLPLFHRENEFIEAKKYSREEICQLSSLLYRSEKYDLIIHYAKELIKENPELNEKEENVFYEGFKYKMANELKSFSKLVEIEKKEIKKKKKRAVYIKELIDPVKKGIIDLANDFDSLIDIIIAKAKTYSEMVKFMKWKMDFIRYKCQCLDKKEDSELLKTENTLFEEQFTKAEDVAKFYLKEDDPIFLDLYLCKAIYTYEVLDKPEDAMKIAFNCMETINKSENKKKLSRELQVIRDDYIIWSKKSKSDLNL